MGLRAVPPTPWWWNAEICLALSILLSASLWLLAKLIPNLFDVLVQSLWCLIPKRDYEKETSNISPLKIFAIQFYNYLNMRHIVTVELSFARVVWLHLLVGILSDAIKRCSWNMGLEELKKSFVLSPTTKWHRLI